MMASDAVSGGAGAAAPASRRGVRSALLASLEWALVLGAVGLWSATRGYSLLLPVGSGLWVAAWLVRWLRTGQLTRATPLDGFLALLMLSALLGLWAAPDRSLALNRWYLWLGALGLYYAVANSSPTAHRWGTLGLVLLAAALGVYFATQHRWGEDSVKFTMVREAGLWLNQIVPDAGQYKPHPNVVAGIMGIMAPAAAGLVIGGWNAWRARRGGGDLLEAGAAGLAALIILAALVMTESRASWLGVAAIAPVGAWWWICSRAGGATGWRLFLIGLALAAGAAAAIVAWRPDLLTVAMGTLPGPGQTALARLPLFGQAWRLAADTAFTGGGLGAFPGLYSTFILDIPYLHLTHAHNAYLNLLVEQGWLGLLGYLLTGLGAGWLAARGLAEAPSERRPLLAAGAAGLVVLAVQGLGDATLVASRALPFMLAPAAGIAASLPRDDRSWAALGSRRLWASLGACLLALAAMGVLMRRPLAAAWHANLGAVAYDRAALAGWPPNQWSERPQAAGLEAALPELQAALAQDPANLTAHYRLGLRSRMAQDFETAATHLQQALAADPGHRGVVKTLGYTYAWLGRFEEALPLLEQIPEARGELETYRWWWGTQARSDLARNADGMLRAMGN
jgi:tetratricopeptide (TPR) repeat protein